jgi:hypothetical protein
MRHPFTQLEISRNSEPAPPEALARLWSQSSLLKEVWVVVQAIGAWPDVMIAPDHSGLSLTLRGANLGHVGWSGRMVLPFSPEVAERLVTEGMASRAPDAHDAAEVVFDIFSLADADRAVWLLRLAYQSVHCKLDDLFRYSERF